MVSAVVLVAIMIAVNVAYFFATANGNNTGRVDVPAQASGPADQLVTTAVGVSPTGSADQRRRPDLFRLLVASCAVFVAVAVGWAVFFRPTPDEISRRDHAVLQAIDVLSSVQGRQELQYAESGRYMEGLINSGGVIKYVSTARDGQSYWAEERSFSEGVECAVYVRKGDSTSVSNRLYMSDWNLSSDNPIACRRTGMVWDAFRWTGVADIDLGDLYRRLLSARSTRGY